MPPDYRLPQRRNVPAGTHRKHVMSRSWGPGNLVYTLVPSPGRTADGRNLWVMADGQPEPVPPGVPEVHLLGPDVAADWFGSTDLGSHLMQPLPLRDQIRHDGGAPGANADPWDYVARGVFADWLDEQGLTDEHGLPLSDHERNVARWIINNHHMIPPPDDTPPPVPGPDDIDHNAPMGPSTLLAHDQVPAAYADEGHPHLQEPRYTTAPPAAEQWAGTPHRPARGTFQTGSNQSNRNFLTGPPEARVIGAPRPTAYSMDTWTALHEAINRNPHDWQLQGVLADWCDENGRSEEAADRRALMEWMRAQAALPEHARQPWVEGSPAAESGYVRFHMHPPIGRYDLREPNETHMARPNFWALFTDQYGRDRLDEVHTDPYTALLSAREWVTGVPSPPYERPEPVPPAPDPAGYARPEVPTAYTDDSTLRALFDQLRHPDNIPHRRGEGDPLQGVRGILADALDENDRFEEAQLLRTPGRHVLATDDGRVVPGEMSAVPAQVAFHRLMNHITALNHDDYPTPELTVLEPGGERRLAHLTGEEHLVAPLPPGHVRVVDETPNYDMEAEGVRHWQGPYDHLPAWLHERARQHMNEVEPHDPIYPGEVYDPAEISRTWALWDAIRDAPVELQSMSASPADVDRGIAGARPAFDLDGPDGPDGPEEPPLGEIPVQLSRYGLAEDIAHMHQQIRQEPRDLSRHLVLADMLNDRDGEGGQDEAFRRNLAGWMQDRLTFTPPVAGRHNHLAQPGRTGTDQYFVRSWQPSPLQPRPSALVHDRVPTLTGSEWSGDEVNWQWMRPVYGAGTTVPLGGALQDTLRWSLGGPPGEGHTLRDEMFPRALSPAERLVTGVGDLNTVDWEHLHAGDREHLNKRPGLWGEVENTLRVRHDNGQRLEGDETPTAYEHSATWHGRSPTTPWVTPAEAQWHDWGQPHRYGLAPEPQVRSFAQQGREGGQYQQLNVPDLVFADFLEGHGDPREHIVRRDIEHRGPNISDFTANMDGNTARLAPGHYPAMNHPHARTYAHPDGTSVIVLPFAHQDWARNGDLPGAYHIMWSIDARRSGEENNLYMGSFSPDEALPLIDAIAAEAGDDHTHRPLPGPDEAEHLSRYASAEELMWHPPYVQDEFTQAGYSLVPTEYGEEDELLRATSPHDWHGQLVLADWYADHDRPHEEGFRRQLGGWIQDRIGQPGHKPDPRLAQDYQPVPQPRGERDAGYQIRTWNGQTSPWGVPGPGTDVYGHKFEPFWAPGHDMPAWDHAGSQELGPVEWGYLPHFLKKGLNGGDPYTGPGTAGFDNALYWGMRENLDGLDFGGRELSRPERLLTGIDPLSGLDPENPAHVGLWDQVQQLLRHRHSQGQRLENDTDPTGYAQSGEPYRPLYGTAEPVPVDPGATGGEPGPLGYAHQPKYYLPGSRPILPRPTFTPGQSHLSPVGRGRAPDEVQQRLRAELASRRARMGPPGMARMEDDRAPTAYTDPSTMQALFDQLNLPEQEPHRWGDTHPLTGLRGVLADAMDELGRHDEAELLRTERQPVEVMPTGRVGPILPSPIELHHFDGTDAYMHVHPRNGRSVIMGTENGPWGADVYPSTEAMEQGHWLPEFEFWNGDGPHEFGTKEELLAALQAAGHVHPQAQFPFPAPLRDGYEGEHNFEREGRMEDDGELYTGGAAPTHYAPGGPFDPGTPLRPEGFLVRQQLPPEPGPFGLGSRHQVIGGRPWEDWTARTRAMLEQFVLDNPDEVYALGVLADHIEDGGDPEGAAVVRQAYWDAVDPPLPAGDTFVPAVFHPPGGWPEEAPREMPMVDPEEHRRRMEEWHERMGGLPGAYSYAPAPVAYGDDDRPSYAHGPNKRAFDYRPQSWSMHGGYHHRQHTQPHFDQSADSDDPGDEEFHPSPKKPTDYGDREELEQVARDNPFEFTPRGMLADWHQQFGGEDGMGDEREAAFQRKYGEWMAARGAEHAPQLPYPTVVRRDDMPPWAAGRIPLGRRTAESPNRWWPGSNEYGSWTRPDAMEEAFRRAHNQHGPMPDTPEEFLEGDEQPQMYGLAEDIADLHGQINQNPLELSNHLVLADMLNEAGRPEDENFRRAVAEMLSTRLSTPFPTDPHASGRVNSRGMLIQAPRGFSEAHVPTERVWHEDANSGSWNTFDLRPAYDTRLAIGEPPWSWENWGQNWQGHNLPMPARSFDAARAGDGWQPGLHWQDWTEGRIGRVPDGLADHERARTLTPAERAAFDLTDLTAADPKSFSWMQAEQVLRPRWDRHQKFAGAGTPTRYGGFTSEADFLRMLQANPEDRTTALIYADWLDDNGQGAKARLVRAHVEQHQTGATEEYRGPPHWAGTWRLHGGPRSVGGEWSVQSSWYPRNPGTDKGLGWDADLPADDAHAIARELLRTGHEPHGGSYWQHGFDSYWGQHARPEQRIYDQAPPDPERLSRYAHPDDTVFGPTNWNWDDSSARPGHDAGDIFNAPDVPWAFPFDPAAPVARALYPQEPRPPRDPWGEAYEGAAPVGYGPAEDIANMHALIRGEPRELSNHLVLADMLADRDGPGREDERFRRDLAEVIRTRLSTPFPAPGDRTGEAGVMVHEPRGFTSGNIPTERVWSRSHPVLRHDLRPAWDDGEDDWFWRGWQAHHISPGEHAPTPEQLAAAMQVPVGTEDDQVYGTWLWNRDDDLQLTAAERAAFDLDDLTTLDPMHWLGAEGVLGRTWAKRQSFADTDLPTEYGLQDDIDNVYAQTLQNPLELSNHLVMADMINEQRGDGSPQEAFRRAVADTLTRRLSTPWQEPTTDPHGNFLAQQPWGPEGSYFHDVRGRPRSESWSWMHLRPAPSSVHNTAWAGPHTPDRDWVWDVDMMREGLHLDDPRIAGLPTLGTWRDARMQGDFPGMVHHGIRRAHDLAPAERLFAGIDNPANLDPRHWPALEALMLDRHRRGERLEGDETPTEYGVPGGSPDYHGMAQRLLNGRPRLRLLAPDLSGHTITDAQSLKKFLDAGGTVPPGVQDPGTAADGVFTLDDTDSWHPSVSEHEYYPGASNETDDEWAASQDALNGRLPAPAYEEVDTDAPGQGWQLVTGDPHGFDNWAAQKSGDGWEEFNRTWNQPDRARGRAERREPYARYQRTDYGDVEDLADAARLNPDDYTTRAILADALDERHGRVTPTSDFLRTHQGPAWMGPHWGTGELLAGPQLSIEDIRAANGDEYHWVPPGQWHPRTGAGPAAPNGEHYGFFPAFVDPILDLDPEQGGAENELWYNTPSGVVSGPSGHFFAVGSNEDMGRFARVFRFNPATSGISEVGNTAHWGGLREFMRWRAFTDPALFA